MMGPPRTSRPPIPARRHGRAKDAAVRAKGRRRRQAPSGLLLAMLVGMVVVPTILSAAAGIVALALWREAFDLVFGVLVITFGVAAIVGGGAAVVFARRNARLAELQADFVANLSHELRTPLAGIRLVTETLEAGRGGDPGRLAVLTEMLGDEVRRLEDLVERVLTSRHMAGEVPALRLEPVEVAPLVREAVAGIAGLPEARDASIEVTAAADLPPVLGDRSLLLQAVRNLVHNAVKFGGDAGPVEVTAGREASAAVVTVADRGPGIAEAEHRRIFERFYRGDARPTRNPGSGLGLDIVRSVTEEHGGAVTVDSALGQGARFTMRLPLMAEGGTR